jgi:sortase A
VPTARPPQRLASPEPPPQQVLTIPWPRVPLNKDSDPRRRVPVGAVITGVLGELLITCGLLLGLYVVWELVWSTVEAKPVQAYALEEVHQRTTYIKPAEPAPGVAYAPEYTENLPEVATCAENQPCYSLHVPRWGDDYDVAIAEGTSDYVLNNGWIGHYTQTQGVGELGNFAVAGHRITHGEPFAKIQALRDGDALIVETDEYYFVYEVYGHEIVLPDEVDVIWPVPREEGAEPLRRLITLTTCHPRYVSTHRYIVWGELSYWTKKSEGPLRALAPEDLRGEG